MKLDGECLSHLRFADDIFIILICANIPHDLQETIQELADESDRHNLKINKSKTKGMIETDTRIHINNTQFENVGSYIYLPGTEIQLQRETTKLFKEKSRPDGQHSSNTATSSRVTLEHA